MKLSTRVRSVKVWSVVAAIGVVLGLVFVPAPAAEAADVQNFNPGYIIDDALFYNSSLTTEAGIQHFLESKVPNCGATTGPACLKNYRADSAPRSADKYCKLPYPGGNNQLASTIIYNVAQACNINPQVLLVTMQKERGLVTDVVPTNGDYNVTMGYACPDTALCDTRYYGFANQLYSAARQFNVYPANRDLFRYDSGVMNTIQWHPKAACGSSQVFIQNDATAALYNYTPYRPNDAALNAGYAISADPCSSYGNRNFWMYFTDWFGSTTISQPAQAFVKSVYQDVLGRQPGNAEIGSWGKALMGGMASGHVAGGFVGSDEFRLLKIDEAYRSVLGREPEPAGRLGWLNGIRAGTLTPDDVSRVFMSTDEYFLRSGGTMESYVAAVYERILKRTAASNEIAYWAELAHAHGRGTIVNLIWFSTETARARVADMYNVYLGRPASWDELVGWGDTALRVGDTATRSAILGSGEYWVRSMNRFP